MRRGLVALGTLAIAVAGLAFVSDVAEATPGQIDVTPTCPTDYPPDTAQGSGEIVVTDAQFTPGGSGSLSLAGTVPDHSYIGTIFSTPIDIGPSHSDAAGNVSFTFAVPADFELSALHNVTLTCGDVLSANFQICLSATGSLAPAATCLAAGVITPTTTATTTGSGSGSGSLARTGLDYVFLLLKLALILLACGTLVVYAQRRRATPQHP